MSIAGACFSLYRQILGWPLPAFDSNSEALLGQVAAAYAGLPEHRLPLSLPELHVELRLAARPPLLTGR